MTERIRLNWRGGQVTRLEALSDAVFGFAITLLVVSLDVPDTFDGLVTTMKAFPAFAASFALLILVWLFHYRFFKRYDLDDGVTIFLPQTEQLVRVERDVHHPRKPSTSRPPRR